MELSKVSEALKPHLSPPEPVTLRYTIRPDGPPTAHPDCYDFEVEVPLRWGWGGGECGQVLERSENAISRLYGRPKTGF